MDRLIEIRTWGRLGSFPELRQLAPAVLAVAIALAAFPIFYPRIAPTDAYVYLAAGERLNAGHRLYGLAPGDRVIASNPPYWDVPTLSPPLLGVLWRPLATLGSTGMLIGWALTGVAFLFALAVVAARARPAGVVLVTILMAPAGIQLGLGNVNGLVALGLVVSWLCRDRPALLGSMVAFLGMIKVTPLVLVFWLIATRRVAALGWFVIALLILIAISIVGAGWNAQLDYLGVITQTSSVGSSDLSLAGLARALGVAREVAWLAPWLVLVIGVAAMTWLRARPEITFAIAVTILVLGSPVVQLYWFALLIPGLTPFASNERTPAFDKA